MDNRSHKPKREVKSSKFKQRIVDVAYEALIYGKIRSRKDNSTSVEKQVQQSPEVSDCGESPIDSNTTNWSKVPMSEKQLPYKIKEKRGASSIESPAIKSTKRIKLVEYEHSSTTESASETERVDTSSKSPEQSPVRKAKVAIPRANRVNSASSSADPLTESVSMTGSTARSLHHPWNSLDICLGDRGSQSTDLNLNFQSNSQVGHSFGDQTKEALPTVPCALEAATNNSVVRLQEINESSSEVENQFYGTDKIRSQSPVEEGGHKISLSVEKDALPSRNLTSVSDIHDFKHKRIVVVRELTPNISEGDIYDSLANSGLEPEVIHLVKDQAGISKNVAFVKFSTVKDANDWIEVQQGVLVLRGSEATLHYNIQRYGQDNDNTNNGIKINNLNTRDNCVVTDKNDVEDPNATKLFEENVELDSPFLTQQENENIVEAEFIFEASVDISSVSYEELEHNMLYDEPMYNEEPSHNTEADLFRDSSYLPQGPIGNLTEGVPEVPVKKLTRKKIRDPSNWKQNQRKIRRNDGKEYVNANGKLVAPKPITSCSKCRLKCTEKISTQEQIQLRECYNKLPDNNAKKSYVCQLVKQFDSKAKEKPKKLYNYYLPMGNTEVNVCRTFFCGTFGIYLHSVSNTFKHNVDELSMSYTGRKESINSAKNQRSKLKRNYCKEHINILPKVESHYRRAESKREYLETQCRSIPKCYNMFKIWMKEKGLSDEFISSLAIYRQVFNEEFNLSFHKPKNDVCQLCFLYKTKESNDDLSEEEKIEFQKHKDDKNRARLEKKMDDLNGEHQIHFDLMNTTSLPISKVGSFFYKSHLTAYNLTAAACIPRKPDSTDVEESLVANIVTENPNNEDLINVDATLEASRCQATPSSSNNIYNVPVDPGKENNVSRKANNIDTVTEGHVEENVRPRNTINDSGIDDTSNHGNDMSINPKKPKYDIVGYSAAWNESQHGREASDLCNGLYQILLSHVEKYKPTKIVLWSDGPTAQNKNSIMTVMLKHVLAQSPYLESITHKFGYPNHNFMQKVDNLHSQMEKRCRDLEIWSQEDLINLWAQETEVIDMMDKQHFNFGSLSKHEGLVLKNVPYTKVCALRYYKNDIFGVEMKLDNFDNEWEKVNIRKLCRQKTRVGMPQEIASFPSPMAIPSVPRKLSKAKIDCLKDYIKYMNGSNKEWLENILKNCA